VPLQDIAHGVGRTVGAGVQDGDLIGQFASVFSDVPPDPLALVADNSAGCRSGLYIGQQMAEFGPVDGQRPVDADVDVAQLLPPLPSPDNSDGRIRSMPAWSSVPQSARKENTVTIQTSSTNPLRIAAVPFGDQGGLIGVTFAPGKQQPGGMTAHHQRDLGADLDVIAAWNAAAVVTLVEGHELGALGIAAIGAEVRRRHMEWHHWPIGDYQVPDTAFMAAWPACSASLRGLLARGGRVLLHCKGGLGRAGSVVARLLVEDGMNADAAIAAVRAVRPGAIETGAQAVWVAQGCPTELPQPDTSRSAARDRAEGVLLGLAVGDAVGAAIEFEPKPRFARLDDMAAGGPHRLRRGQWTDDTAMALALSDSLLADDRLDADDLMRRFLDWLDTGAYSCTNTCFDVGTQTRAALERYRQHGEPNAGSVDPAASGNGALMRLAPVAIRHWRDQAELARVTAAQTRTTHGSPATLAASATLSALLAEAIAGVDLTTLLSGLAADGIDGGWRGLHRDAIEGSGYVVRSLQAAVWAVSRSTDFRSAVLLAANLGQDADTTAAIAGQLAGAIYGANGIPAAWLDALAWRDRLTDTAGLLFEAGWPEMNVEGDAARDKSLQERLRALAAFRPIFGRDGFVLATTIPSRVEDGIIVLGGSILAEDARRFYEMAYDYGWVRPLDWSAWRDTPAGQRLIQDPVAMMLASPDDLACVLTTCIRADRFCDGYLNDAFASGLITRVLARAEALLASDETTAG